MAESRAVHFIAFDPKDPGKYWSAVKIWGKPGYVHPGWDTRAKRDIADGDLLVFAKGTIDDPPREKNFSDTLECSQLEHLSTLAGEAIKRRFPEP